jgi:hypothetical protein
MSDTRLRELERIYRETGSVEDARAYLRERVRLGQVDWGRLALAGYLGDPEMRRLFNMRGRTEFGRHAELKKWALRLRPWGREVWARVAVAAGDAVLTLRGVEGNPQAQPVLDAARAWAECPCTDHAEAAQRLAAGNPADLHPYWRPAHHAGHAVGQWAGLFPPRPSRRPSMRSRRPRPPWGRTTQAASPRSTARSGCG